jgi:hypothetical protein
MDRLKVRSRHDYCLGWKVGRRASCSWLVVPAVTHLRVARKHQQVIHGSNFHPSSHHSTIQGTNRGPGEMGSAPQAVWLMTWGSVGLRVRLRRVKRSMLVSERVTRQRIRVNWTSTDGINNDEEKLLT